MMADLIWIIRASLRLWCYKPPLVRNALAWCGLALQMSSLFLLASACMSWGACAERLFLQVAILISAAVLFSVGAAAVCFGSHFPRNPQTSDGLRGAELLVMDGPPDAPGGLLVIISGYGSESPAFCEPESLRQTWSGDSRATPLLQYYRRRLFLHLHGGIGWNYEATSVISSSLEALLNRDEYKVWSQNRPNLVIGHSRGCQVAAATAAFRASNWRRIAVHPPFGVQFCTRLFAVFDPGITEIHRVGVRMAEKISAAEITHPATFPWDRILQARGFDHTVLRHAAAPDLPLENESPFGSHISPFTRIQAPLWKELLRNPLSTPESGPV